MAQKKGKLNPPLTSSAPPLQREAKGLNPPCCFATSPFTKGGKENQTTIANITTTITTSPNIHLHQHTHPSPQPLRYHLHNPHHYYSHLQLLTQFHIVHTNTYKWSHLSLAFDETSSTTKKAKIYKKVENSNFFIKNLNIVFSYSQRHEKSKS